MVRHMVFYGTLMNKSGRRGMQSHKGLNFVGDITIPGELYDVGAFPALIKGEDEVKAELFEAVGEEIDRSALQTYDMIEGYYGDAEGDLYTRDTINIPGVGPAWIYYWNRDIRGLKHIESGDWYNYSNHK